ncbi:MAG: response regulator [Desulfobacteraceae bacterium]|nr:MAG: response regulator [Desulfobacteraceae bacterium]
MDNILVIEDQDGLLTFLRETLTIMGYQVKIAHDGEEGIKLFNNREDFDLVITDICMPRMDGNAVAKHIRNSDKPATPIVAITGFGESIEKGLFDISLLKPFKVQALLGAIRSLT